MVAIVTPSKSRATEAAESLVVLDHVVRAFLNLESLDDLEEALTAGLSHAQIACRTYEAAPSTLRELERPGLEFDGLFEPSRDHSHPSCAGWMKDDRRETRTQAVCGTGH